MHKILTLVLLLCCGFTVDAQRSGDGGKVIGRVNGEPVTQEEYSFFIKKNKQKVIAKFRNEYKLAYHADFWQDKSKAKMPSEVLKEMTIETIVNSKVQYLLAKQYGIINNISFLSIQQYMDEENKQRKNALKQNVVIYGPVQYTMESYYEYLTTNMVIKVKDYMLKNSIITVDIDKGIQRVNTSTMHDDDKYYSKVHIANTQINYQYDEIIKLMIERANIKFDKQINQ